ncbi:MAG TPA: YciI family protein [Pararobbsia sp.]|nr:YciI family protein [Pararobbsia sp.]
MHYTVYCLDHDGMVESRLAHYDAHKAYLATTPVKMVMSGPLLAADEQTMIGSFFLFEADSIAEVQRFNANDPFHAAGIWKSVDIRPFNKRVDNR